MSNYTSHSPWWSQQIGLQTLRKLIRGHRSSGIKLIVSAFRRYTELASTEQQLCPELKKAPARSINQMKVDDRRKKKTHHQLTHQLYSSSLHQARRTLGLSHQAFERGKPPRTTITSESEKARTSKAIPVNPDAFAALSAIDRPPDTLPVKDTNSMDGCWITCVVREGDKWTTWITSFGTPAWVNASANLSAVRGVCGEGFSKTALPAMMAGRTELIDTRYGKLQCLKVVFGGLLL